MARQFSVLLVLLSLLVLAITIQARAVKPSSPKLSTIQKKTKQKHLSFLQNFNGSPLRMRTPCTPRRKNPPLMTLSSVSDSEEDFFWITLISRKKIVFFLLFSLSSIAFSPLDYDFNHDYYFNHDYDYDYYCGYDYDYGCDYYYFHSKVGEMWLMP